MKQWVYYPNQIISGLSHIDGLLTRPIQEAKQRCLQLEDHCTGISCQNLGQCTIRSGDKFERSEPQYARQSFKYECLTSNSIIWHSFKVFLSICS